MGKEKQKEIAGVEVHSTVSEFREKWEHSVEKPTPLHKDCSTSIVIEMATNGKFNLVYLLSFCKKFRSL